MSEIYGPFNANTAATANLSQYTSVNQFEFTNEYHTTANHHNFCELLYVDKGQITVHSESYDGILSVNQLIIHRPNEVHSLESSTSAAPNVIIIGFECKSPELIPFSTSPVTLTGEQAKSLAKIMQEGMSIYEPPYDIPNTEFMKKRKEYPFGADQMIKIGLEAFLINLVREFNYEAGIKSSGGTASPQSIQAVHQYIKEHYTERITLDNLCFLFGTNKTSLCRDFKLEYGVTVLTFINELRIREAKTLLREKNASVTEISEKLGFDSIHYFCRIFKKSTGQSPTQYAKSIRAKLNI